MTLTVVVAITKGGAVEVYIGATAKIKWGVCWRNWGCCRCSLTICSNVVSCFIHRWGIRFQAWNRGYEKDEDPKDHESLHHHLIPCFKGTLMKSSAPRPAPLIYIYIHRWKIIQQIDRVRSRVGGHWAVSIYYSTFCLACVHCWLWL